MIAAEIYIALFLGYSFVITIFHKEEIFKSKTKVVLYILFVVSLAIIAYNMVALPNWDLGRHYLLLDIIRDSNLNFMQFVFGGKKYYDADGYSTLVAYNIYRYIIVRIFKNNAWFQTITTIIVYSLQFYIIYDYEKTEKNIKDPTILVMLISFAFLPLLYVTSGIRNALSASVAALSVYLYLYKKCNVICMIVLMFIAATIHPCVLLVVPFIILAKFKMGLKTVAIVIGAPIVFKIIASIIAKSSFRYLKYLGKSYLLYTGGNQYRGGRGNLYGILIISIIFIFYFWVNRDKEKESLNIKKSSYVNNFIFLMLIYMVENFQNYDMVLRPGYIIGMFSPFLVTQMYKNNIQFCGKWNNAVKRVLNFVIMLMCIYVNYKCMELFVNAF